VYKKGFLCVLYYSVIGIKASYNVANGNLNLNAFDQGQFIIVVDIVGDIYFYACTSEFLYAKSYELSADLSDSQKDTCKIIASEDDPIKHYLAMSKNTDIETNKQNDDACPICYNANGSSPKCVPLGDPIKYISDFSGTWATPTSTNPMSFICQNCHLVLDGNAVNKLVNDIKVNPSVFYDPTIEEFLFDGFLLDRSGNFKLDGFPYTLSPEVIKMFRKRNIEIDVQDLISLAPPLIRQGSTPNGGGKRNYTKKNRLLRKKKFTKRIEKISKNLTKKRLKRKRKRKTRKNI
jgi:hypothetical protein